MIKVALSPIMRQRNDQQIRFWDHAAKVFRDVLIYSPSDMVGSFTALIIPHAPALIREIVRDLNDVLSAN